MSQPLTRHLTEDEIDLLLDDESQVVTIPLREHLRDCAHCQQALERAGTIVALLDALPHPAPSGALGDRIMQEVHVFEPVSVTVRDFVRQVVMPLIQPFIPARTGHRAILALAASAGVLVAVFGGIVLLRNIDIGVFVTQVGVDHLLTLAAAAARDIASAVLGPAAPFVTQGRVSTTLLLFAAWFAVTAGVVTVGLRRLLRHTRR